MRLIDADELVDILIVNRYYPFGVSIDEVPTVDAVPVIRCKDCKYYDGKWCKLHAISDFDLNDVMKSADDFCSYAERKEEND